jgi:hypothetical protein
MFCVIGSECGFFIPETIKRSIMGVMHDFLLTSIGFEYEKAGDIYSEECV